MAVGQMRTLARRPPRHFVAATLAAWLALAGRTEDAQAEMDRILACVSAGSGRRQLAAAARPARTRRPGALAHLTAQIHPQAAILMSRRHTDLTKCGCRTNGWPTRTGLPRSTRSAPS